MPDFDKGAILLLNMQSNTNANIQLPQMTAGGANVSPSSGSTPHILPSLPTSTSSASSGPPYGYPQPAHPPFSASGTGPASLLPLTNVSYSTQPPTLPLPQIVYQVTSPQQRQQTQQQTQQTQQQQQQQQQTQQQQQQQQQQQAPTVSSASLAQQQQPMKTGSNNPFSLDNITKHKETRELVNPFSQTNFNGEGGNPQHQQLGTPFGQQQPQQQQQQPSSNPFGAQEQQQQPQLQQTGYQPTFGGLEKLPTVSVFPQTQQNPQQQATSVTPAQYEPQQQTNSTNSMQFVPQQTGFNPFMQPTQQFQPQPQYQQTYSQQPNQNLQTAYTQQQLQQHQLQQQQQQQRSQQYYTEGPNLIDI